MRKYIHTALIIFALALPCFGQFTEIWTNGDLFAVNEMASQCYSASVERCVAVGVTPNSPSWFDYFLGKNHAKLASVKANISAVRPYFVKPSLDVLAELSARDSAVWTNDAHFLTDCGLPTNAIAETPYFKSQYASTTGGWIHCWRMLTNQVVSQHSGAYTETNQWFVFSDSPTNWDEAVSGATPMAYTNNNQMFEAVAPSRYTAGILDLGGYFAEAYNTYMFLGYKFTGTVPSRSATVYHKGEAAFYWDNVIPDVVYTTNRVFDAQGTSISNGWWYVGAIAETNASSVIGLPVGKDGSATNNPGVPVFSVSAPVVDSEGGNPYYAETLGWDTADERIILNWTATTNGFKYK